jgi:hypothetical protein
MEADEEDDGAKAKELKWMHLLATKKFQNNNFKIIKGDQVNYDWASQSGFREPVIIHDPRGLEMTMPPADLTVRQIAQSVGYSRTVEVLQVSTQAEMTMSMKDWATYFETPAHKRRRIFNVISLEISDSGLGKSIQRPLLTRQLDWVDHVWPKQALSRKRKQSEDESQEFPKVQVYCLMSVKNSYTDFHIDFGGSSVFYHLLRGRKIFYFIRPTRENLCKYKNWSSSVDQSKRFFADEVDECVQVILEAGHT